jgi:NAD(P)-dependent dehydrogenase (short-subunit alcohol dehydrogenase family)
LGRLDGAVNNAGGRPDFASLPDYPEESFYRDLAVNLKSVFLCMKYESPRILSRGRGGAIVNVSSIAGIVGTSFSCGYNAAKAGILGLTRPATVEVARDGICINALCLGFTLTPLTQSVISKSAHLGYTEEKIGSAASGRRMATADEQAAARNCIHAVA